LAEAKTTGSALPAIVFLGPSLPVADARAVLDAEYRPPIKRGDLEAIADGRMVAIIDGVFQQSLSVAPREITSALARGLRIFGASSMGALRAAEVPGMVGVGTTFRWFRDGVIERDDEVALVFDADTFKPRSVPLVNVRFALAELTKQGVLTAKRARSLLDHARRVHFSERTYPAILRAARADDPDLRAKLSSFDLKRQDALELLDGLARGTLVASTSRAWEVESSAETPQASANPHGASAVVIWEDGDVVFLDRLARWLKTSGVYDRAARTAAALAAMGQPPPRATPEIDALVPPVTDRFQELRLTWGWWSAEEVKVTLADLGLTKLDVQAALIAERRLRSAAARIEPADLREALFLDGLSLKREALRCAAFDRVVAKARAQGLSPASRGDARAILCRANGTATWSECVTALRASGVTDDERERFVDDLTMARALAADPYARRPLPRNIEPAKKAPGSRRFCWPPKDAWAAAQKIAKRIGVTRVGIIGQLADLPIHVSQAFRPGSPWSSTTGSGKSSTMLGAKIGAVLEEAEKFSQERFEPAPSRIRTATERDLRSAGERLLSPRDLDLPFDSPYDEGHAIEWIRADDLASRRRFLAPLAAFTSTTRPHDPFFSARLGRKEFSTSGLASGFALAEALLAALCESLERHARRLLELSIDTGLAWPRHEAIAHATLPPRLARLVASFQKRDLRMRLLDMTTSIGVPAFEGVVFREDVERERTGATGHACHPDPEVAAEMALLEAAQAYAVSIAGAREDLTLAERSLGRHERSSSAGAEAYWRRVSPIIPTKPFSAVAGFVVDDVVRELDFVVGAICAAGFGPILWLELTAPEMRPARAVRVKVAGLETSSPFHTGLTARRFVLEDLLGRGDASTPAAPRRSARSERAPAKRSGGAASRSRRGR
jgi:ribosomal protein S12 methylthiotransferase accessory factor